MKRSSRYFGIAEFAERPIAKDEGAVVDDDFELTAAVDGIIDVSGNVAGVVTLADVRRSLTVLDAVIPRQTGALAQARLGYGVRHPLGCIKIQLDIAAIHVQGTNDFTPYSVRKAEFGSKVLALRAGRKPATSETANKSIATIVKTAGSRVLTIINI